MSPEIRVVAFDDLDPRGAYELWRLRQDVFVVEQQSAYPDLDGRDPEAGTRHLLALDAGVLVGTLRLVEDGAGARIGRVAVAPHARGQGVGRALLAAAMGLVGDRPLRLDAQTPQVGFYASFGFVATGPEYADDGVPHVPMLRDPAVTPG